MNMRGLTSLLLVTVALSLNGSQHKPPRPSPTPSADARLRQHAQAEFEEGQKAHGQGRIEEALAHYSRALDLVPDFPEALYQRALAHLTRDHVDAAADDLQRLIEMEKDLLPDISSADPAVRSFFARVHNLRAELLVRRNETTLAEEELSKALERDPSWHRARLNLAALFLSRRAFDRAIAELNEVIAHDPAPALAFRLLGAAYEQTGRDEEAIESYSKALLGDPADSFAREGRSRLLLARKDYVRAIEDLEILHKNDPSPERTLRLADAYALADAREKAIALCRKLVEEDPKNRAARDRLIAWLDTSGRTEEAITEARRATDIFPTDARCWTRLGELLLRTDAPQAAGAYGQAVALEPNNLIIRANFGSALLKSRRFTDALEQFQWVLERDPHNAQAHAGAGTAFYELKDYARAVPHFAWIVDRQPQQAVAHYFLALCYDRLGQYEQAVTLYEKFITLADPARHKNEIENARLRIPPLKRLIEQRKK
jgi:tetratricopeptide (TPR) repeat protein